MLALNETQLHLNSGAKVSCFLQAYWCRVQDYLKLNGPTELERADEGGFEHCTTNSACKAANLTEAQNLPQEQQQQVDTGNNENKGNGKYPKRGKKLIDYSKKRNGTRNARHNGTTQRKGERLRDEKHSTHTLGAENQSPRYKVRSD